RRISRSSSRHWSVASTTGISSGRSPGTEGAAKGSVEHVESLHLDAHESSSETGQRSVKARLRMRGDRVAQRRRPGLQVGGEELALARKVGHLHVIAGDQVAHHLAQV